MASSLASMSLDAEASQPQEAAQELTAVDNSDCPSQKRRRKWTFFLRRRDEAPSAGNFKFKALSISCSCTSSVKGSCMIATASFIELTGNLLGLLYGILYIQSALNFYAAGNDQDVWSPKAVQEQDEKRGRVVFLQKNRVGFVGLLATCLIGLIVSFLMPIGTIYKSWKSLRSAMSLLFAMCLAQVILTSIYMTNTELIAFSAAVPFRVYEIFLISNYIQFYKRKKQEEALGNCPKPPMSGSASVHSSQTGVGDASQASISNEKYLGKRDTINGNEVLRLDLSDCDNMDPNAPLGASDEEERRGNKRDHRRRKRAFARMWQSRNRKSKDPYNSPRGRYQEHDWK